MEGSSNGLLLSFTSAREPNHPPGRLESNMKKPVSIVLWMLVALMGALAYGVVALHRGEPLNAVWLLAAAACTYSIGYRFYSKWIAARIMALDDRRATPCHGPRGRQGFRPHQQMDRLRPPLRRHQRARPPGGPGAGGPVRLPARHPVDPHRRGARRRGAGLLHPLLLHPPRRQVPGRDGQGGDRQARRASWP